MNLYDDVRSIKGVGEVLAAKLSSLGIFTVKDLLYYFPRKYDDYSSVIKIVNIKPGKLTVKVKLKDVKAYYVRRGLHITTALATDLTGSIRIVWYNRPYLSKQLQNDCEYFLLGEYGTSGGRMSLSNPSIYRNDKDDKDLIKPIYKETKGLDSAMITRCLKEVLSKISNIPETLPTVIIKKYHLLPIQTALLYVHFPKTPKQLEQARQRLSFEELFQLQLAAEFSRQIIEQSPAPVIDFNQEIASQFVNNLKFKLTDDQRKTVWQIYQDMSKSQPMNRLVEGDVGSGKTVVAAMAAIMAINAGYQVLLMAPTEILALQHAESVRQLLGHTIWAKSVDVLTGSIKTKERVLLHERIKKGKSKLIIGTHAIIQDKIVTENVGLVIVDEQHRFGVEQRQKLRSKGGLFPHFLAMTATPIPRTLALTLYGELDISLIRTNPSHKKEILTEVIPFETRFNLYQQIDSHIVNGRQVFVVCPLIEKSQTLNVNDAVSIHDEISKKLLKHRRISLLHGKMKPEEKEQIMQQFSKHQVDVLVSTTVIEVGVNIPNASVMIIEGAERFGLAQIHQLRGRVGRGEHQGYCYLVPSLDSKAYKRLNMVSNISDGFKLAEIDLELRGPGSIYGTRQSGVLDLRIASLNDRDMINQVKLAVKDFMDKNLNIRDYPELDQRVKHFSSITKLN